MSDKNNFRQLECTTGGKVSKKAERTRGRIDKSLAFDPRFADAYSRLAIIYQSEGMYDETVTVLEKGLSVAPGDEILLLMRKSAEICREKGKSLP